MSYIQHFDDGLTWVKSSRSGDSGGNCVFVNLGAATTGIRDSKDGPAGLPLWMSADDWQGLKTAIRAGGLDHA